MTLDEILTAARPVDAPHAASLDRARAAAVEAAHADIVRHAHAARRRHRRRVLGGVGLAAAATGAFLVLPRDDADPAGFGAAPTTAPRVIEANYTTASQVLTAAAVAAGDAADPLGDAPYWKVVTQQGSDESTRRSFWVGVDGPGLFRTTGVDGAEELLEVPQATFVLDGRAYSWRDINAGELPPGQLSRLLTEEEFSKGPSTKTDRAPVEHYLFKEAYGVLGLSPASPAVREELWKTLAALPGVVLDGQVTDSLGRAGWSVTLAIPGWPSTTYVVDATTGALLEVRGPEGDGGEVFVEAGPASSAPKPTARAIDPTAGADVEPRAGVMPCPAAQSAG